MFKVLILYYLEKKKKGKSMFCEKSNAKKMKQQCWDKMIMYFQSKVRTQVTVLPDEKQVLKS